MRDVSGGEAAVNRALISKAALILTFSQGEKEPPLPEGEGWGEGQDVSNQAQRALDPFVEATRGSTNFLTRSGRSGAARSS